jgi:hypothetical protein
MTRFTPRHLPRRAALALAATLAPSSLAPASSHREAPFITTAPKVDGTDFCMFRSYETGRADGVSLIANCQPLQDANGGPNCFAPDPNVLHEIHVDNNGDAKEDPTFQFRFNNTVAASGNGVTLPIGGKNVATALIQRQADREPRRRHHLCQAAGQHRHENHPPLRQLRRPPHLHGQHPRLKHARQAFSRPAPVTTSSAAGPPPSCAKPVC